MGGATGTSVDSFTPDKKRSTRRRKILEIIVAEPGKWNRSRLADELGVDFRDIEDDVIRLRRDDMLVEKTGRLSPTDDGVLIVTHALKRMGTPKPKPPAPSKKSARPPEQCDAIVVSELRSKPGLTAGDLWRRTTLDVEEVKRAVDRLEQRGDVVRIAGSRFRLVGREVVHIDDIEAEMNAKTEAESSSESDPPEPDPLDDLDVLGATVDPVVDPPVVDPPVVDPPVVDPPVTPLLDQRVNRVVEIINERGTGVSPAEIREETGWDRNRCTSTLSAARARGLTKATGSRRTRRYHPPGAVVPTVRRVSDRGLSEVEARAKSTPTPTPTTTPTPKREPTKRRVTDAEILALLPNTTKGVTAGAPVSESAIYQRLVRLRERNIVKSERKDGGWWWSKAPTTPPPGARGGGDQNVRVKCARCGNWMRYGKESKATPRTRSMVRADFCVPCAQWKPTQMPVPAPAPKPAPTLEEKLTDNKVNDQDDADLADVVRDLTAEQPPPRHPIVLTPLPATVAELARQELEDAEADLARLTLEVALQTVKVETLQRLAGAAFD